MDLNTIWLILTVIFLSFGTIGNILSIITLTNKHCKKSSYTVYLTGLAIADTLALYMFVYTVNAQKGNFGVYNLVTKSALFCKLHFALLSLFCCVSVWLIVILALERAFSVFFPFKAKTVCKPKNAFIVTASIVAFYTVFYSHYLYGMQLQSVVGLNDNSLVSNASINVSRNDNVSLPQLDINSNGSNKNVIYDENDNGTKCHTIDDENDPFVQTEMSTIEEMITEDPMNHSFPIDCNPMEDKSGK